MKLVFAMIFLGLSGNSLFAEPNSLDLCQVVNAEQKTTWPDPCVEPCIAVAAAITMNSLEPLRDLDISCVNKICALSGGTALHAAAEHGSVEIVAFLISKGADLSATNRDGATPLHVAAAKDCTAVVAALLKAGAPIDVRSTK
ncbi:MAG: ankyrin repeat domain-containing protein, partial [bacterium]